MNGESTKPCPVCRGVPETPRSVNVGQTGYHTVLITCSHPCHDEARRKQLITATDEIKRLRFALDNLAENNYKQHCKIIRLRAAGEVLAEYVRDNGAGLHDDEVALALWEDADREQ